MEISRRITPEILAAATGILQPYCPSLSATDLVQAISNHRSEKAKHQTLQPSLTYSEFAKLAGISLPSVHRMAARGEIPKVRIGMRSIRIPYAAVEKILTGTQSLLEVAK
jgi:excisionase family DNA binding protein